MWDLKLAILSTRDLRLWDVLSFCSIIVNFMHTCNGTDGRLNLHKWVWRCSSLIPPSMSANILSMSTLTFIPQISKDLLCIFMCMEKNMWEFWSSFSFIPSFYLFSVLYPSLFLFTEVISVLRLSVAIDCFLLCIRNCWLISAAPGVAAAEGNIEWR